MAPESAPLVGRPRRDPALTVNLRVIEALVIREMLTRFGRNNLGFLWLILEPMLFVMIITAVWTATRDVHQSNFPIASLALSGYSGTLLWRYPASRCINAVAGNRSLLYHRQVKMIDVFFARILLELVGVSAAFVILGFILFSIGWIETPEDPLKMLAAWSMIAWFATGLGLTIGSASERVPAIAKIWPPISLVLFIFSGAAFTVDALPPAFREIALWIPMIHGVEFLRDGFFGSRFNPHYSIFYLACWSAGLTVFGLALTQQLRLDEAEGE